MSEKRRRAVEISDDAYEDLKKKYASLLDMDRLTTVLTKSFGEYGGKKGIEFKLKEGLNQFNIIPFVMSENNPSVYTNRKNLGKGTYRLQLLAHRDIGTQDGWWACPGNWGEPCPVCEEAKKAFADGDKDKGKALITKERNFYLTHDPDCSVPRLGLFHTPVKKSFGDNLKEAATVGGKRVRFADPSKDIGRIVQVNGFEDTFNGNKFIKDGRIDFLPREEEVPDDILDGVPCLDEFIVRHTYEDLAVILHGSGATENDEESEEEEYEAFVDEEEEIIVNEPEKEVPNKCKFGHAFGEDWEEEDNAKDCARCKVGKKTGVIYTECMEISNDA